MRNPLLILCLVSSILFSCAKVLPTNCASKIQKNDTTIKVGQDQHATLDIQYLGCGGLLLTKDKAKLLVDPFFTNPKPFASLLTKKIDPDTPTIHLAFRSINHVGVQQILVTHAHYDHLLDVPYIITKYYDGKIPVMASNTANNMLLKKGVAPRNLTALEVNAARGTIAGKWFYTSLDSTCRVMPVIYEHAPHYKLFRIFPIRLYKGHYDKEPKKLRIANHWKEGQTLAYLVDFMAADTIQLRVYLLAAGAANPGIGNINHIPELATKRIDLMVLCVASFEYVSDYPESILKAHNPKYVLGAHWEDFFVDFFPTNNKKGVRLTNVPKFFKRMDSTEWKHNWRLANPLVNLKFKF
jgi:hypothetical protein